MPLRLDLAATDAKIARARLHLEALEREVALALEKRKPYSARIGKVNDDGWVSIFLTPDYDPEIDLGVIVGDVIHNLRSALDYIVTALADRSGTKISSKHQFPIFTSIDGYRKSIGDASSPKKDGMLGGLIYGVRDVWDVQPFHTKPNPEVNALFIVNRFSNADKHRSIVQSLPLLDGGSGRLTHSGTAIAQMELPPLGDWEPNLEYEVGRVRFAEPYPTDVHFEADVSVKMTFGTPAFAQLPLGHAIEVGGLHVCCDHVAMVADRFRRL